MKTNDKINNAIEKIKKEERVKFEKLNKNQKIVNVLSALGIIIAVVFYGFVAGLKLQWYWELILVILNWVMIWTFIEFYSRNNELKTVKIITIVTRQEKRKACSKCIKSYELPKGVKGKKGEQCYWCCSKIWS